MTSRSRQAETYDVRNGNFRWGQERMQHRNAEAARCLAGTISDAEGHGSVLISAALYLAAAIIEAQSVDDLDN